MSIESVRRRLGAATSGPCRWRVPTLRSCALLFHAPTDLALLLAVAEVMKGQDHRQCSSPDAACAVCDAYSCEASPHCHFCGALWPCPSTLALDALEAAE